MESNFEEGRRISELSVAEFLDRFGKRLSLERQGAAVGLDRSIGEPTVNRPGLALAGFFTYFARHRVQVLGNSEMSYMRSLSPQQREERFSELCRRNLPMLVVSRGASLEPRLVDTANEAGIGVFRTPMISMQFINEATLALEWQFAPTASMHGCMVDVQGIGVMILGKSGTGKSETVVGRLDRGASLVADDLVRLRAVGGEVLGRSPELGRAHMEVRGLGLINVAAIFGIAKIRMEKRLDFIVRMTPQHEMKEIERLGVKGSVLRVLGHDIPYVELPVAPGRDMARMVEVAALDQKLRGMGYDTAEEFNRRLIELMDSQTDERNR